MPRLVWHSLRARWGVESLRALGFTPRAVLCMLRHPAVYEYFGSDPLAVEPHFRHAFSAAPAGPGSMGACQSNSAAVGLAGRGPQALQHGVQQVGGEGGSNSSLAAWVDSLARAGWGGQGGFWGGGSPSESGSDGGMLGQVQEQRNARVLAELQAVVPGLCAGGSRVVLRGRHRE